MTEDEVVKLKNELVRSMATAVAETLSKLKTGSSTELGFVFALANASAIITAGFAIRFVHETRGLKEEEFYKLVSNAIKDLFDEAISNRASLLAKMKQ